MMDLLNIVFNKTDGMHCQTMIAIEVNIYIY